MVKRTMVAVVIAALSLAFASCSTEPATSFTISGDAALAEIVELNVYEPEYECRIVDVNVAMLAGRIAISVEVVDPDYADHVYVATLAPVGTFVGSSSYFGIQTAETSTYTIVMSIPSSASYRFLFGRIPADSPAESYYEFEADLGFDVTLASYWMRSHVGHAYFDMPSDSSEGPYDMNTPYGRTEQNVSISFADEDVAVTSVKFWFYEAVSGKLDTTAEFDLPTARSASGRAELTDALVTGLIPGTKYRVVATGSGNDGVGDFVDSYLGESEYTAGTFVGMWHYTPAHYAYALPRGFVSGSGYRFDVFLFDDGTRVLPDGVSRDFLLTVRDEDDRITYQVALRANEAMVIVVPTAYLQFDHHVTIDSAAGDFRLCTVVLPFREPNLNAYTHLITEEDTVRISWYPNDGVLVSGWVRVYYQEELVTEVASDQWVAGEEAAFPLVGTFDDPQDFRIACEYVYEAFDGQETVTVSDPDV